MEYEVFEHWLDGELARLDQLDEFLDAEIAEKNLRPIRDHYSRTYIGDLQIVEISCGRIYVLNGVGKPLGVIATHPRVCSELKETDKLQVKLGWRNNFWHFLRVDSIGYASPEEDLANQRRKRKQFIERNPALAEQLGMTDDLH